MPTAAFTGYIDVAQVALYAFWLFFAGLIFYLRSEDKREGYPLESERSPNVRVEGFPPIPKPKRFILPHGGSVLAPRAEASVAVDAKAIGNWPGAPLDPGETPMLSGIGPGAYAGRADIPDAMYDTGAPKLVPLRADHEHSLANEDADPRGMKVLGADGKVAGTVSDVWVDRTEMIVRYLEVAVPLGDSAHYVLVPMPLAMINGDRREVRVDAVKAEHFITAPGLANPEQVTLLEEDRISAYFGGGTLYADPSRMEPLI
jgi:photosynthetic reaction center H subunit